MSICSVEVIRNRVESAEMHSPMCVFKEYVDGKILLNAVFYTEETKKRIEMGDSRYIGSYTRVSDLKGMERKLKRATRVYNS